MKRDDGAGSRLAEKVRGHVSADCIDAGAAPENCLEKIVRLQPNTVLLVDVCHFNGTPGDIRLFDPEDLSDAGMSTHSLSLNMCSTYLKERCGARTVLAGIQPEYVEFGEDLSPPVASAVDRLAEMLIAWC
jgi:hydrogenase maturation protease HycI